MAPLRTPSGILAALLLTTLPAAMAASGELAAILHRNGLPEERIRHILSLDRN